ncbi:hypothetical protein GE09DRAFT_645998 [Coniochaeta sp. 2T2.1]|nr:hypothetical protein GE09DRAFT_645998 [Coniochaeta sp. 2T2.1]
MTASSTSRPLSHKTTTQDYHTRLPHKTTTQDNHTRQRTRLPRLPTNPPTKLPQDLQDCRTTQPACTILSHTPLLHFHALLSLTLSTTHYCHPLTHSLPHTTLVSYTQLLLPDCYTSYKIRTQRPCKAQNTSLSQQIFFSSQRSRFASLQATGMPIWSITAKQTIVSQLGRSPWHGVLSIAKTNITHGSAAALLATGEHTASNPWPSLISMDGS